MKSSSGSYILIIEIREKCEISIGKLGIIAFQAGYYAYIGSAMNFQLYNRVHRHIKPKSQKKMHWHIDYLLAHDFSRIVKILLFPSHKREECCISHEFHRNYPIFIPKFGSSDCECPSHLYFLKYDLLY